MEQSEWIQELTELEKELGQITWGKEVKGNILIFAHLARHFDNGSGGGEIDGLFTFLKMGVSIQKVDELIGWHLHWYVKYGDTADLDDEEDVFKKEQAELQIKYCQMIDSFDMEAWTPEIKRRFEDGLDFLRVSLKQESVTADQGVSE